METVKRIGKYRRGILYLIFFGAAFFIAYQTPYCHDEWSWGLPARVELMKRGFENYNGRYLGNLLALLITRSALAKTLIISAGTTLVLYVADVCIASGEEKGSDKDILCLILEAILLFSIPRTLFAQSYGWPAAFVNFVPPVILFLIFYKWTEKIYVSSEWNYSPGKAAAVIPLGIATQLFSEHITIFTVVYAIWILIYGKIKSKKFHMLHVNYLLATAAGAILMFSNGAYHQAATKPTGYKHITLSFEVMYKQFCKGILDNLFLNNWILNTFLAAALIALIIQRNKKDLPATEMVLVFAGYSMYSIWHRLNPSWVFFSSESLNSLIEIGLSALFFINVLLCIWINVGKEQRMTICILYCSMAAVAVPLLAASPIGARCFYISYVLECITVMKIMKELLKETQTDLYQATVMAAFSGCLLLVVYMRMFAMIGSVDRSRETIIAEAVAAEAAEVVLPILPYAEFTWTTEPGDERWADFFKEFYGIPEEMSVIFQ